MTNVKIPWLVTKVSLRRRRRRRRTYGTIRLSRCAAGKKYNEILHSCLSSNIFTSSFPKYHIVFVNFYKSMPKMGVSYNALKDFFVSSHSFLEQFFL